MVRIGSPGLCVERSGSGKPKTCGSCGSGSPALVRTTAKTLIGFTWAVCGGKDAEHDVLVERALEVSAQAVQHAVIRHVEVQHLGTTVRVFSKKNRVEDPKPDPCVGGPPGS
jgi:hypothetical protein